ncbi:MAG: hypothetical protein IMZ61_10255 [Planctomycetes bacterium]|nr:hypothetical protein [Planctomycetota bacterium]
MAAEDSLPDAVFLEVTAIILDELAIVIRMDAESRQNETESIELALDYYRPICRMVAPATIDGGDVLRVGCR